MMNATESKVLVWDVPTRVFHWLLAASFLGAYISGDSERWRDIHVILGYTMLGLIGFRLIWGFAGSRYARFSSFLYGPRRVLRYLASLVRGEPEHYLGHNPAGSLAIFTLLALGIATGVTGFATYNELGGEWLEEAHEVAANGMLAVVVIHIAGVVVSSVLHGENLVRSMLTGLKAGRSEEGIARRHTWLAVVLLAAVAAFWYAYPKGGGGAGEAAKHGVDAPWVAKEGHGKNGKHDHDD